MSFLISLIYTSLTRIFEYHERALGDHQNIRKSLNLIQRHERTCIANLLVEYMRTIRLERVTLAYSSYCKPLCFWLQGEFLKNGPRIVERGDLARGGTAFAGVLVVGMSRLPTQPAFLFLPTLTPSL